MTSYFAGGHSLRGRIGHVRGRTALEPVPRFYAIVAVVGIGAFAGNH